MKTFRQYLVEKPLNTAQRMKRSRQMKRLAPKIKMKRKLSMRKKASSDKIKERAEKKARDIVRKKLAGGKSYNDLSYTEKMKIDKKLELKTALVKKTAKKLIPQIKKMEAERIKNLNKKA
jgi:hypothetical protein